MKNYLSISFFKAVLVVCIALISAGEVFSFQSTFVPVDESRLWFEGRSNVNEFECLAENYSGQANLPQFNDASALLDRITDVLSVQIEIEVDSIECGKNKMNNDLQKALKADTFPEITFTFQKANLISQPETQDDAFEVEVHGKLTVAGNTREISFRTNAYYLNDQRVRAVGQTTIRMTEFGVEPPTALMGLIRADEELTVHFDLIATGNN